MFWTTLGFTKCIDLRLLASRAAHGRVHTSRRRAGVEGNGQGVEHQTGEPEAKPLSWLAGDHPRWVRTGFVHDYHLC